MGVESVVTDEPKPSILGGAVTLTEQKREAKAAREAESLAKAKKAKENAPTAERNGKNESHGAGLAVKFVSAIKSMHGRGQLTTVEYVVLNYYRDTASKAQDEKGEQSPSNPEKMMSAGTSGTVTGSIPNGLRSTWASDETSRLERILGPNLAVAQAIARDDQSPSQYAVERFGGWQKNGKIVPKDGTVARIVDEVKTAARRLMK